MQRRWRSFGAAPIGSSRCPTTRSQRRSGFSIAATHSCAEGAGAVALPALIKDRERLQGRPAAVILSGQNIAHGCKPFWRGTRRGFADSHRAVTICTCESMTVGCARRPISMRWGLRGGASQIASRASDHRPGDGLKQVVHFVVAQAWPAPIEQRFCLETPADFRIILPRTAAFIGISEDGREPSHPRGR